jgi:hypothetical protein
VTDAPEAVAFRRQVDRWIIDATVTGTLNFDELVRALPGVYPPVVADGLDRLLGAGAIASAAHRTAIGRTKTRRQPATTSGPVLPPPHPLDFDWRYAPAAIDELLARVTAVTKPGETVVLLGTPSLYLAAYQRELARRFVLIDYSSVILDRLATSGAPGTLHVRDLILDAVPDLSAAAVVADPPWYPEHIEAFLWAAARCARTDAPLFITLPGLGTRPGWRREREQFRRQAAAQGLRAIGAAPATLPYLSPPFEINALAAAGWHDLPMDWRRGDLVVLTASGRPQSRRDWAATPPLWEERTLGWVRIRVRKGVTAVVDPVLRRLVDGDVLADVSRRHPIRVHVDVWTSGNRVYRCTSPEVLLAIVDAMTVGVDPVQRVANKLDRPLSRAERARVAKSASQVRWIARVEGRELARLGWKAPPAWAERIAS